MSGQLPELTDEQKQHLQRIEMNRMFDLAEKPIMEYICMHLKMTPKVLFKTFEVMGSKSNPLIMNPIPEYNDKYLAFSLEIVPYDYKLIIPDALKEIESINYTLGFIYHSVTTVYDSILNSNINDDVTELFINSSFHLEMDDDSISMFPVYIFPARREFLMLTQIKTEIEKLIDELPKEGVVKLSPGLTLEIQKVHEKHNIITTRLNAINYDNDLAAKQEHDINESFKTNNRLGIVFNELSVDQLPEGFKIST